MSGQSLTVSTSETTAPEAHGSEESGERAFCFAFQSPDIEPFISALAESLLGEGISEEGPPF
jgi:hypothetical protein